MRKLLAALFMVSLAAMPLSSQQTAEPAIPEADAADVESLDAIIHALYDVISGPAGPRDWDRFHSLFAPGAHLIPTRRGEDGTWGSRVWTPEQYSEQAGQWFSSNAFYEVEAHRHVAEYGNLVHAFSTYESRREPDEDPFVRGINSIQLLNDGSRWWILTVMWADENSAGELPEEYLPHDH